MSATKPLPGWVPSPSDADLVEKFKSATFSLTSNTTYWASGCEYANPVEAPGVLKYQSDAMMSALRPVWHRLQEEGGLAKHPDFKPIVEAMQTVPASELNNLYAVAVRIAPQLGIAIFEPNPWARFSDKPAP
jgi:hypothetical protein